MAPLLLTIGISTLAGGTFGGVSAYYNGTDILSGIIGGAIIGAAIGASIPLAAASLPGFAMALGMNFAAGMASNAVETVGNGGRLNGEQMLKSGVSSAIHGALFFGAGRILRGAGVDVTRIGPIKSYGISFVVDHLNYAIDLPLQYLFGNKLSKDEAKSKYKDVWWI